MSGVYVVEIVPRKKNYFILKIGNSSDCVEKRIYEMVNSKFDKKNHSYYIISMLAASKDVVYLLENFIRNEFINKYNIKPFIGREYFKIKDRSIIDIFSTEIDGIVLDFYNTFKCYSTFDKSLGSIIKAKRKLLKKSQTEISKNIGVRQATISDIENGKLGTFFTLKKILNELDLQIIVLDNSKLNSQVLCE